MKKLIVGILFVSISNTSIADNSKCWDGTGQDDKSRPDVICKELTEKFILGFKNKSREDVIKRMTSPGIQRSENLIHYLSNTDKYDGDINFYFANNRVTAITAVVTSINEKDNYRLVWNENSNYFCSSFPGSSNKCPDDIISPIGMLGFEENSATGKSIQAVIDK